MGKKKKAYTTAKPLNRKLVAARAKWLKTKYPGIPEEKRIRMFSKSVALDYNTCVRYFNLGRTPAPLYLERIQAAHPDFPV